MLPSTSSNREAGRRRMGEVSGESSDRSSRLPWSNLQTQKRLLFDRRYGWVFDEWKDPSEEALAGGRGMFCVVPIATGLLKMAFHSINFAVESVSRVLDSSDPISPQALLGNLSIHCQKLVDFSKAPNVNYSAAMQTEHSIHNSLTDVKPSS